MRPNALLPHSGNTELDPNADGGRQQVDLSQKLTCRQILTGKQSLVRVTVDVTEARQQKGKARRNRESIADKLTPVQRIGAGV